MICTCYYLHFTAFSASTLFGIRKSIRPVKIEWWGVGVVICLERGAACLHMVLLMPQHPKIPSSLASFKSRLVLPFWYRITQVVPENRPLNGCSSSSSNVCISFCRWIICHWTRMLVVTGWGLFWLIRHPPPTCSWCVRHQAMKSDRTGLHRSAQSSTCRVTCSAVRQSIVYFAIAVAYFRKQKNMCYDMLLFVLLPFPLRTTLLPSSLPPPLLILSQAKLAVCLFILLLVTDRNTDKLNRPR